MDFIIILLSLIPGIMYAILIWATLPYGSINIRDSINFSIASFTAVFLAITLNIKPEFDSYATFNLWQAFINAGLIEELSKFIAWAIWTKLYNEPRGRIQTMFNYAMVGLGFSIIENIMYGNNYGVTVLVSRLFTSTPIHIGLGIIAGYLVTYDLSPGNRSFLQAVLFRWRKLRDFVNYFIAIFVSALFHGAYDYPLFIGGEFSLALAIIMLIITASTAWLLLINIKNE